jgi:pimeloyl-ACP methyl ester carboxylesterase
VSSLELSSTRHDWVELSGLKLFFREAGPRDAPVLLLLHGYPCSSFQFRHLMPALSDRWRTLAPDFPGFGYSDTPDPNGFSYDFDAFERMVSEFAQRMALSRYCLWLHDYGSQIGLRHAIARPERIAGLIIQNGDIYEDALGPKYQAIKEYWAEPTAQRRKPLEDAVSEEGFRAEFVGEVGPDVAARISPDLWKLHWPLMNTRVRRQMSVGLMEGLKANLAWFPRYQRYLRERQPKTLIVWGPQDGYMPEPAARAYLRDLPDAELHVFRDAGHWLLESHLAEAVPLIRAHLERVFSKE